MIKNIVFDLGNVLLSFMPSDFLDKKNYPENFKKRILSDVFESQEWQMIDRGEMTALEAIDSIALKSSLKKEEISHIFNLRTEMLFPLDGNVKLLPALKKQGYRLYFLSNFPGDIFEEIESGYYFFRYFDGGVISAHARFTKPDIRIYAHLLEKYSLKAEESLFFDDLEQNVQASISAGIKGIVTHGSLDISKIVADALVLHNK